MYMVSLIFPNNGLFPCNHLCLNVMANKIPVLLEITILIISAYYYD